MLLLLAIVLLLLLPSPWNSILPAACLLLGVGEVAFWWRRVRHTRLQTGSETMIGARAKVVATCRPDGEVWIEGARWRANCEAGADVGDMVTVTSRQGLVLFVERA